jgi:hypothetical protein
MIPISKLTFEEAQERNHLSHEDLEERNASTQRHLRKIYSKNEVQHTLDWRQETNSTNAGRVNQYQIEEDKAAAQKILAAGGRLLDQPNTFGAHAGAARADAAYKRNLRRTAFQR